MHGDIFIGWAADPTPSPLVRRHHATPRGRARPWVPRARPRHAAVVWPREVPMAMVVGSTGGGKTTLLRVMATSAIHAAAGRALVLADGKGAGAFLMFSGQPGVVLANGSREIGDAIAGLHDQLTTRLGKLDQARQQAAATRGPAGLLPFKRLDFWLDEYIAWVLDLNPPERTEAIRMLTRVGLLGREVDVHLLLAMQRPDQRAIDTGLPGGLKAQLKLRVAATGLMGMDGLESMMCFGYTTAADLLPCRRGIGMVRAGRHQAIFQVPWLADPTSPDTTPADRQAAWARLPKAEELVG